MDDFYSKHYILTDSTGCIIDGWSDGPQSGRDTAGAICINDQGGYQFRLDTGGEENPALRDMDGIPLYKWDGAQVLPRTAEEMEADRAELPEPGPPQGDLSARVAELEEELAAAKILLGLAE